MPSKEAIFITEMFKNMVRDSNRTYKEEREEARNREKRPLPVDVTLKELNLAGNYAELIEKPGNNGPLVMYVHGGGFKTGAAQERREITFEVVEKYGSNVIANNYRLSPENKWPAHLEDSVNTYLEIIKSGYKPENIVLMGESAGASIIIAMVLYAIDNNLPLPKATVLYSGSINHGGHFKSHFENAETDYMLGDSVSKDDDITEVYGPGEEGVKLSKSKYASPFNADFTGFPPTYIAVSDAEALYDDSVLLYKALKEKNVNVKLHIGNDLIHAYPIFNTLPESIETMQETFAFINSL